MGLNILKLFLSKKNKKMNNMKNIFSLKTLWSVLYFLAGIALMGGIWELISNLTKNEIPSPRNTWIVFKEVIQNPMQDDPDYKGIGVKLLSSLKRVGIGFGCGSLVAIPIGMLMGSNKIIMNIINPMVQILRPVSPLAWFPLGLAIFQDSPQASIFMIFICSLWPTLINTAFGVAIFRRIIKMLVKLLDFQHGKTLQRS